MKSISILLAAMVSGCSAVPRHATTGQIPRDAPAFVARLECGMTAEIVDRMLADNGLSIAYLGNSFHWQGSTPLGTNYSLSLSFKSGLNTILIEDAEWNVLFARTSVRRTGDGVWKPVWTPEKDSLSRRGEIKGLREATQDQMAIVAGLREDIASSEHHQIKKQELATREEIIAALTLRLQQLEEPANKPLEATGVPPAPQR